MKRISAICSILFIFCFFVTSFAQDPQVKVAVLFSEQNIDSPERAWWVINIELSTVNTTISKILTDKGYQVLGAANMRYFTLQDPTYRVTNLPYFKALTLGHKSLSDYVVVGRAVATGGGNVSQPNMLSCAANITAQVIKVKDDKVIAYLDASGSSENANAVAGGSEAISKAAKDLTAKLLELLKKEEEK